MDAKVDDAKPARMVSAQPVKYPRYKNRMFTDERGNIKYVNMVVKCP